jgi:hypothetical protein
MAKGKDFSNSTDQSFRRISRIVVAAYKNADEGVYAKNILDRDKRWSFCSTKFKDQMYGGRMLFANHRYDLKDLPHWMEKQVYMECTFIWCMP